MDRATAWEAPDGRRVAQGCVMGGDSDVCGVNALSGIRLSDQKGRF